MTESTTQTAEQAAVQIYSVERAAKAPVAENASFESYFGDPKRNPFLGWNSDPHTIRSFQFLDVVLDGEFRGLFNSDGFIRGTGYLVPDEVMAQFDVDVSRLVRSTSDATVIVGCTVGYANYFHWMTQALPAIDHAVGRIGQAQRVLIALPQLNAWQEDSLRLLGLAGIKRMTIEDTSKKYALAKAEFSELLNGGAAFSNSTVASETYSRLRASIDRPTLRDKKVYVARTDAITRQMRNEGAVIDEIRRRGYEVVAPGILPLTEQIRLFRSARIVVGAHGAGMTNIVFCEPETIVYELVPAHYTNACFCNLAQICNLRYWADAFASEGDGLPNLRAWESDTGSVIERLDEIERIDVGLQQQAKQRTISAMDFLRGVPGRVAKA
jgi:capsular polysaccharide biosynthesis protein